MLTYSNFGDIFLILLIEWLFHFYLFPENNEFLVYRRVAKLTVHHLKNGFKVIIKLRFLNISIDDSQIDVSGKSGNCLTDKNWKQFVPLFLYLGRIVEVALHLLQRILHFLKLTLLLKPSHSLCQLRILVELVLEIFIFICILSIRLEASLSNSCSSLLSRLRNIEVLCYIIYTPVLNDRIYVHFILRSHALVKIFIPWLILIRPIS